MANIALVLPGRAASSTAELPQRIAQRIVSEETAGHRLALRGRTAALIAVAGLLLVIAPLPQVLYYEALLGLFLLAGFIRPWLERAGLYRPWHDQALIALDFALLTFTLLYPNPLAGPHFHPQTALRSGNFVYVFVLLAVLAFSFRPGAVLWGGAIGAGCWLIGVAVLASLPDSVVYLTLGPDTFMAAQAEPGFINLGEEIQNVAVLLIVASLTAFVVARSRRLVLRQATLERERGNLARYFKPETVDRLAQQDRPMAQVREQDAAILFADIVGFTRWSEAHSPAETIGLLREVHSQLEEAVFRHDGTLDKFIGDGMMATFGTPEPGPRDATNALACAIAILAGFEAWNARRVVAGQRPARISVGVHYGPVVVGNIGTERRLEFGVLGDTVNVAKRLEAISRDLDCRAVISLTAAAAAVRETPEEAQALLKGFALRGPQALRNRAEKVAVMTYD